MEIDYLDSTPADGRILAFTIARKTITMANKYWKNEK
jgi:hypothetical protein